MHFNVPGLHVNPSTIKQTNMERAKPEMSGKRCERARNSRNSATHSSCFYETFSCTCIFSRLFNFRYCSISPLWKCICLKERNAPPENISPHWIVQSHQVQILDNKPYLLFFNFGTFDSFCGWSGQKLSVQCMLLCQKGPYASLNQFSKANKRS